MNSTQAKQTSGTSTHRARDGGVDLGTTEETPTLMLVFKAIRQIHDAGGEPTRARIVAMTGLKPTAVDGRIKVLRGEGMISPLKQCYRAAAPACGRAACLLHSHAQRGLQDRKGR